MQVQKAENPIVSKTLHICYVITRSDVMGGASVHLLDLAAGVQQQGHRVTILVGGDGIVNQRAKAMGLTIIALKNLVRPIHVFKDIACWFELRTWFRQLQPDLIHLHSSKAGLVGRFAAIGLKVPVVFTAHGWAFTEGVGLAGSLLYRILERWVAPLTDQIITVSEYDRQRALQLKVGTPQLIRTIRNGMPELPVVPESAHQSRRMIMVARFEQPKDHLLLLDAVSRLSGCWQLQCIGDGPLFAAAQQQALAAGLNDRVEFSGARSDVPEQLAQASIFVLLSRWEGLPLTILEAMRAGLAVVASDVGGVKEAVQHGLNGLLVQNNAAEVRAVLQQLLDDPQLVKQLGEAGRKKFEQEFTFQRMMQQTIDVYQQLHEITKSGAQQ